MNYTLGTASKATGKSKATILRAIRTGKFSAEKDASGVWRIEPSELHRVYPETHIETVSESNDDALVNPSKHLEAPLLEERLASAQKEITHLKAQVRISSGCDRTWKRGGRYAEAPYLARTVRRKPF